MTHYILCGTEAVRFFQNSDFESLEKLNQENEGLDMELIAYSPNSTNFPLLINTLSNWLEFCYLTQEEVNLIAKKTSIEIPDLHIVYDGIYWSTLDLKAKAKSNFEELKKEHPQEFAHLESWEQLYDKSKFPEQLEKMINSHDASIGITWETVAEYVGQCEIKQSNLFYISGFYKDDKTKFSDYLVYAYDSAPEDEDINEDDIFFFGLSENDIQEAIASGWNTTHDFVITSYEKATI